MLREKPHIHLMKLHNAYYMYDVNTSGILTLPRHIYEYLSKLMVSADDEYEDREKLYNDLDEVSKQEIQYLISQSFLMPVNKSTKIEHIETNSLESLYKYNIKSLTLQVTQNCNLRCNYCVYSGSYSNRKHTNKRMSWDVAKKCIDFLLQHSSNSESIALGFYGGEPLLEIQLVKKCVEYAKTLFKGKDLLFTMTTNATLLTDDIINFLGENNFSLLISLDGPSDIQDKNRVFADQHKGTFEIIMKNLERIKEVNEKLLDKISFNAVIDLSQNFSCANEFFLNYNMVKDFYVAGNFVNNTSRKEELPIKYEYYIDSQYEMFKVFLYNCTDIFKTYHPTLLGALVGSVAHDIYERVVIKSEVREISNPGGQCLPGIQRFFVNVDGEFFPCERVNENSKDYAIGDIEHGFDVERAKKMLNVAQLTSEECKQCWSFQFCTQCVATAEQDGKITKKKRLSVCESTRKNAEDKIKNYIALKRCNCKFSEMG